MLGHGGEIFLIASHGDRRPYRASGAAVLWTSRYSSLVVISKHYDDSSNKCMISYALHTHWERKGHISISLLSSAAA